MNLTLHQAELLQDLSPIIRAIPEFTHISQSLIQSRIGSEALLLIAEDEDQMVGFKLGYPLSADTFYSWLGGVLPSYRGHGIARSLLHLQENLVRQQGYSKIRVKSMNRFPAMLHLLISEKYQIVDLEQSTSPDADPKIVFEKALA